MTGNKSLQSLLNEAVTAVLALTIVWVILITQVRHHWGGESYYNFGMFVPFLSIWLVLRNLDSLPRSVTGSLRPNLIIAGLSLLLILPFHAVSEVNPFWRLPLWIQASGLVLFTGSVVHSLYGWKGVKAAVFPVFFLSTMIPWPYRMELLIVQNLTQVVVELAVNGLHFLGYPVEVAGRSLVLGDLSIGVNEACSGIRSLQALFMVTLFLGSLFGQSVPRRALAVLLLPFVVIIVNTGRAIFLSIQVIVNGQEAYDSWHDPAGYIAFGISMVLIYACIELLNVGSDESRQSQGVDFQNLVSVWKASSFRKSVVWFMVFPVILFVLVEGWFLYHEATAPPESGWSFNLPEEEEGIIRYETIHPQIESALGYGYGSRFLMRFSRTSGGEFYYYGYGPEDKLASVSSYGHSPAICMEAIGATMLKQFPNIVFQKEGLAIPVTHYLFELHSNNKQLHVFWIVWERRNMDINPEDLKELNYKTQWIQLLKGRRDFSRQVLLASLVGVQDSDEARQTILRLLEEWIDPSAG
ncbi:exosortase/archaeosortase family protein [Puniceicoccales bacterium CK1056]|uniref:Exosortase/archaeosortase family protein n=1 Tax=Oceanipulchritudo coccoides TaxID=2706888 RepID=A0A6B2M2B2_9BACT|nr:exosortase/archaeosortase family protein [Oceanipulchritudo coccoides]NDV62339.1 exosortase/archaeosortase family protein [Oceanipulchritudo coccoides]